ASRAARAGRRSPGLGAQGCRHPRRDPAGRDEGDLEPGDRSAEGRRGAARDPSRGDRGDPLAGEHGADLRVEPDADAAARAGGPRKGGREGQPVGGLGRGRSRGSRDEVAVNEAGRPSVVSTGVPRLFLPPEVYAGGRWTSSEMKLPSWPLWAAASIRSSSVRCAAFGGTTRTLVDAERITCEATLPRSRRSNP